MKKFSFCIAAILTAMTMQAEDVVLPANVKPLLPQGVELTITYLNENIQAKQQEEQPVIKCGTTLYFAATDAAHGCELWKYDAIAKEAKMVADVNPGEGSANPKWMAKCGNRVFFQADNGVNGAELWVTDGTAANTKMVMDIYPDEVGSAPFGITALDKDKVVFFAMDEESEWDPVRKNGPESWVWVSDGTEEGTERIGDTPTKSDNNGTRGHFVIVNGKAVFVGYSKEFNGTIWVTNGTVDGTKPLKNINPRVSTDGVYDTESASIDHLVAVDGRLAAFRATTVKEAVGSDIDWGIEVWMTDGTPEGTKQLGFAINKEESDGKLGSGDFRQTYPIGNHLYFRANNGKNTNGAEPWVWDIDEPIVDGVNPRMIQDCAHNKNVYKYNSHTSCFYEYKDYLYIATNYTYDITNPSTGETKMWDSGYHRLCRGLLKDVWNHDSQDLKPIEGEYLWTGFEIGNGPVAAPAKAPTAVMAAAAMQPFTHKFCTVNDTLFFVCRDKGYEDSSDPSKNVPSNYELWKLDSKVPGSAEFDKPVKVMDLPDDGQISYTMQVRQELYFASASQKQLYVYQMANIIVPFDDDEDPSALNKVKESFRCVRKVVDNGMIYILRDNQKVSILGTTIQ